MKVKVVLEDIIDGLHMNSTEQLIFVNIRTGKVIDLLREFLNAAEDGEDYEDLPEWHQEQMILAIDVLENGGNYRSLPSQFDINEYDMMESFCFMQTDSNQNELLNAIRGRGAFRRFKDKIYDLDVENAWYQFRDESYRQIAMEFCKQHGLEYK